MSRIDWIVCTELYSEFLTVVDVFKCEKFGHMYVEVCNLAEGYKYCPHCKAEVGEADAS